ncbi:MAG: hypothetical protein ABIN15_05410 [candidate division WOR-3 bacterium]
MIIFLFSFYFYTNLLFPISKPNEKPGIGREFVFIYGIKKFNFYFDYSEIEAYSGSDIFIKNYETGFYIKFLIKNLLNISLHPGFVYGVKEKKNLTEKGYFSSFNFLITLKREIFPFLGMKSFYDGKTFLNYLKLGLFFEF